MLSVSLARALRERIKLSVHTNDDADDKVDDTQTHVFAMNGTCRSSKIHRANIVACVSTEHHRCRHRRRSVNINILREKAKLQPDMGWLGALAARPVGFLHAREDVDEINKMA